MNKISNRCTKNDPPHYQCCCQCSGRLTDYGHPHTNGKAASTIRGFICYVPGYKLAHSGWCEHSIGCELWNNLAEKEQFESLFEILAKDTCHLSMNNMIMRHPNYNKICRIGHSAIPWLMEKLTSSDGTLSILLLYAITKEDPVLENHRGKVNKMVQDWKKWWKNKKG